MIPAEYVFLTVVTAAIGLPVVVFAVWVWGNPPGFLADDDGDV